MRTRKQDFFDKSLAPEICIYMSKPLQASRQGLKLLNIMSAKKKISIC